MANEIYEILQRRKQRKENAGAYNSLTVGPPGSGKTSQMLHEAQCFLQWYPDELIFWRDSESSAAQFNRIGDNWKVFTEKDCKLEIRNLTKGKKVDIPYTTFENFEEIINKDTGEGLAEPGRLNVIYFKNDYTWIDFLFHLRRTVGWQTVFIDEIEDIIPLNPTKQEGEKANIRNLKNIEFSNNAKYLRRGLVHLLCTTQSEDEIDWRFKRKLNFTIYLRGAKASNRSRIRQSAIDKLEIGECFIDWENRKYGKSHFKSFPPRRPIFEVIIN